jgi:hypothetical protein
VLADCWDYISKYCNLTNPPFENGEEGGIPGDDSSEQMELRLSGLIVKEQKLRVFNRIYASVFNQSWVDQAFAKLRPYAQALTAWFDSGCQNAIKKAYQSAGRFGKSNKHFR